MKQAQRPDSETLRIFIVLGLLTSFAVVAIHWALNAPRTDPSPIVNKIQTPHLPRTPASQPIITPTPQQSPSPNSR